jgi:hypothetical protein
MRSTRLLVVLAITLSFAGEGQPVEVGQPAIQTAGDPRTTSQSVLLRDEIGDPAQVKGIVEVFAWALGRYDTLGLELPPMTVTFHRQRSSCSDLPGLWTSWDDGVRIDICVGGNRKRAHILLHELAHAWSADHLDQESRDAFVARRGLPSWSGADVEYDLRGTELAAWILVWGLEDDCEPSKYLLGIDDVDLAEEFEHLTGVAPLCNAG